MSAAKKSRSVLATAALCLFGLGVAAALVLPNCMEFRRKARTSEQKSNLGAIRSTIVAYCAEWGSLPIGNLPPAPLADRRGHPEGVPWNSETGFSILGFAPEGKVYCSYAIEGTDLCRAGFTIRMECDTDGDGRLEVYTVDNGTTEIRGPGPNF